MVCFTTFKIYWIVTHDMRCSAYRNFVRFKAVLHSRSGVTPSETNDEDGIVALSPLGACHTAHCIVVNP